MAWLELGSKVVWKMTKTRTPRFGDRHGSNWLESWVSVIDGVMTETAQIDLS